MLPAMPQYSRSRSREWGLESSARARRMTTVTVTRQTPRCCGFNLLFGDPERVKAMALIPEPVTKKEVRRYIGGTAFYSHLVDNYAGLCAPRGELVPKVVSCLQTVGNTISSTSVSRGVFYGPGHQHTRDVVLIQW